MELYTSKTKELNVIYMREKYQNYKNLFDDTTTIKI